MTMLQNTLFPAECRRCGTCCRKGGPTLRLQDRTLVDKGTLPLALLVTIRRGEFVRGVAGGKPYRTESEMIKIKGGGEGWTCALLDTVRNRCTAYDARPVECRAMACWDTAKIERIMETPPLTRTDLLSGVEGLWDMICDHEQRCSLIRVNALSAAIGNGDKPAETELLQMRNYDKALRDLLVERGADPEHLDFLLGRPLDRLLGGFGLKLNSHF